MIPLTFRQRCAEFVKNLNSETRTIFKYARDKNNQRIGLVLAFRDPKDKKVKVGWAKCHVEKDSFDSNVGIFIAAQPARSSSLNEETHWPAPEHCTEEQGICYSTLKPIREEMIERAKKYFKV